MWTHEIKHAADGVQRSVVRDGERSAQVETLIDAQHISQSNALSPERVARTVQVTQAEGDEELLGAALYLGLQHGRLNGKTSVLASVAHGDLPVARLARLEALKGTNLFAQTMDVATFQCFAQSGEAARALVRSTFAGEIERTVQGWAPRFFAGPWARAVLKRELTRRQYVQTLYNMHQYVRFTTRLLGRAVAISPTTPLRNHFLDHLSGEVNHEIIIERDLKHIGADVDYVMKQRVPNAETRMFMVTQQSMVAFEQDPVLFMACPLAAEGITAHLDQEFLDSLRACVASWGYPEPKHATMFFSSHIHTDGGDDGHWQKTIDILDKHIASDIEQQGFLSVLELAMAGIEASFNSNVAELSLFSA